MQTKTVLLARQPIFDRDLTIYAYELLFRHVDAARSLDALGGDVASSEVLLNVFTELPVDEVLQGKKAFVNFTRKLLIEPPAFAAAHSLTVEILETVKPDPDVLRAIRQLKDQGYQIALDDFVYSPEHQGLVDLADIIKIDVLHTGRDALSTQLQALKGFSGQLLAEKVETHDMFSYCRELGFDYFQGYFLCRPQLVSGQKLNENQQSLFRLLSVLQNPEVEVDEIVDALATDPVLSYKLLKLINSAMFQLAREISSIKQAVMLLGLQKIRSWASISALTSSNKPMALADIALTRARLAQQLGERIINSNDELSQSGLTLGILSTLDAFLDKDLSSIVNDLKISSDMKQALLKHEGVLGKLLQTAIHCERGEWSAIDWQSLEHYNISAEDLEHDYIDSLRWSYELLTSIS